MEKWLDIGAALFALVASVFWFLSAYLAQRGFGILSVSSALHVDRNSARIGPQFPHPPQLPQAIIVQPPCELLWIEPVQYGRSAGALLIGSCSSASVPQFEGSKWQ